MGSGGDERTHGGQAPWWPLDSKPQMKSSTLLISRTRRVWQRELSHQQCPFLQTFSYIELHKENIESCTDFAQTQILAPCSSVSPRSDTAAQLLYPLPGWGKAFRLGGGAWQAPGCILTQNRFSEKWKQKKTFPGSWM